MGASVRADQLPLDADGRFSVPIASDGGGGGGGAGVVLEGAGDEISLMARQYFCDWGAEAPMVAHLTLEGDRPPPPPLDARALAKGCDCAAVMVRAIYERTRTAYERVSVLALNRFVPLDGEGLMATPDNDYRVCWYRLTDDQIMLVRGRLPQARYFGLSVCNAWGESLDFVHHPRTSLNHRQIRAAADGSFEVCLSPTRVEHPSWLDTAGHRAGYLIARTLLPEGDIAPLAIEVPYAREWRERSPHAP